MHSYPNAAEGVKSLFVSEILSLIGAVLAGITSFFGAAALGSALNGNNVAAVASVGITGLFGIAVIVVKIVAFILCILGLVKAGKDNKSFSTALLIVLISLLFSFINIFAGVTFISLLISVLDFGVMFFVIQGVCQLLPGTYVEEIGNKVIRIALAVVIIGLLSSILGKIKVIATIASIASAICSIIYYILYLVFLNCAKKEL